MILQKYLREIRREKFTPDLIDLVEYEKDLLYQVKHGITLRPYPTIPNLIHGKWTGSEMQAMRDNREKAQELYEQAKRTKISTQ